MSSPGANGASPTTQAEVFPRLRAEWLTKRYGPVTALADVGFYLNGGEVLGLIGDNGAGKSTLVKLLAGNERPDAGRVFIDGQQSSLHDPSEATSLGIETVYQTLSLIPTLDIVDNIYLAREKIRGKMPTSWLRRLDKGAMRREAAQGFERLGLTLPPLRTKVGALSGGQRQAVAIARAALWGRKILILDEPTASLGVRQSEIVLSLVKSLREQGLAIIYITHNMDHVMRVCDRVLVLRLGRMTAERPLAELDKLTLVAMMTGAYIPENELPHGVPAPDRRTGNRSGGKA
jgi:ABC-type sugar transport system ATPase subunit